MGDALLSREQQIKFMTEAAARRDARRARWSNDPEILAALRQPAESGDEDAAADT